MKHSKPSKPYLLLAVAPLLFSTTLLGYAHQVNADETTEPAPTVISTYSGDISSSGNSVPTIISTPDSNTTETSTVEISQEGQNSNSTEAAKSLTLEEYLSSDASSLAEKVRAGEVTSQELVQLSLEAIKATNPDLNNVISTREEEALKEAQELKDTGQPFLGVPILVKGLGHTIKGSENTNGLTFMEGNISKTSSRYVKALQDAGFIVVGQSSFPEMGWINVTNSDLYGVTHNPWNKDHNPGGSSGGAAAAVAIGQVPLASASDGGGSTRIPAAWSGTIGFFPTIGITLGTADTTYNNVSHFAETKSMADTEKLFNVLLNKEIPASQLSKEQTIAYTYESPAGKVISPEAKEAVQNAVKFLASQGYTLKEVPYPIDGPEMMKSYYTIAASGASTVNFLAKQKLKRNLQLGDTELLTWALYQTSKDLTKEDIQAAHDKIDQLREKMTDFYKQYPIFLTPTNAFPAPKANYNHITEEMKAKLEDMSKLSKEEKLQLIYDQWYPAWTLTPYTQLANLTQTPAISLPTYLSPAGLPLGIMFNTFKENDRSLLELGFLFEKENKFYTYYNRHEKKEDNQEINNSDNSPSPQTVDKKATPTKTSTEPKKVSNMNQTNQDETKPSTSETKSQQIPTQSTDVEMKPMNLQETKSPVNQGNTKENLVTVSSNTSKQLPQTSSTTQVNLSLIGVVASFFATALTLHKRKTN